ncbi:MAG: hypothetical protein M0Q47_00760 [Methanothrix sp.]|jgi:hypothetical protein|uniref:hypothetical protein n=1 Tax=Methanothrix sp. TaxID=90426 RepID=UPI0025DF51FD|nr:hypothetical protein [Methanothrix sp.]MCK9404932.1 hypothetical protein [Methanothrix sp.]
MNPAVAQGENYTRLAVPLGDETNTYAEFATILPSVVNAEPNDQQILNYTGGKDIWTSILLNGSKVDIFLLYPCQPPVGLLDAEGMKSLLASADETILQANFSEAELYIEGRPAIWGMLGASLFAAYQPTNQTAALLVMEGSLDEDTMYHLLYNMSITVTEGMTPIPPGYCSDTTAVDGADAIAADATGTAEATIDGAAAVDASASTGATAAVTQTTSGLNQSQSRKEKAEADRAAAMARLEEAKAAMRN